MAQENDDRVIPIRCMKCHRLRPYPLDYDTVFCGCGGINFEASGIHPDEEQLALKIYSRQIEERNLWRHLL